MQKDLGVELPSSKSLESRLLMRTASRQADPRNPRRSILGALTWHAMVAILAGILNLTMVGGLALTAFGAVVRTDLPTPGMLKEMPLHEPLRVYAADGALVAEYVSSGAVRCPSTRYHP